MAAVGLDIITRIIGYSLNPGDFRLVSENLPIRVALLAEANRNMQDDLDPETPVQITSIAQAAEIGGWGSPIYQAAKILFPASGSGLGGIPLWVYPQAAAVSATSKIIQVAAVGTATNNGTHYVVVCGRNNVEGESYAVNIVSGDTAADIHAKIADAISNVLGSPVDATSTDYYAQAETKWDGLTANDTNITMDTKGNALGITYVVTETQDAAGTPDIDDALELFANNWVTHVVNGYGTVDAIMSVLENFNGKPDATNPTGRYSGTIFKPFLAYTGSVAEDPSSITDARKTQLTIKISPAPLSAGLPIEAAANDVLLAALVAQNTPHLDTIGLAYPDMPTPNSIGLMASATERNRMVKKGCSTVDLVDGVYVIQDPVTTYHPVGDSYPQWRYARNIVIDWNVRYGYMIKEALYVLDHVIANDNDVVTATKVVKPKIWKGVLADYAKELVLRGLCVDAAFMIASITVAISTVNADRFGSFFRYKRSGVVRVSDTTAEAGVNVGTLTAA